jgi:DNA-binding NarL/FixJ family response regulator
MPARSRPFRVMVVDDRNLPRIAARTMLSGATDLVHVGEAGSGDEAIGMLASLKPDVVLMDVDMSGMDGDEATRRILADHPEVTVVAWTVSDSSDDLLRMVRAGCSGYVLKEVGPEELHRAIRAAVRKDSPVPRRMLPDVLRRAAAQTPPRSHIDVKLTPRELQTLRLLAKGLPAKTMAQEMGISLASVDTHLRHLYRKLMVNNRGAAINTGLKLGVLVLADL